MTTQQQSDLGYIPGDYDALYNETFSYNDDPETACVDCGRPGVDSCACCGGALCGMCSETGAMFCNNCPTEAWIDEQSAAA